MDNFFGLRTSLDPSIFDWNHNPKIEKNSGPVKMNNILIASEIIKKPAKKKKLRTREHQEKMKYVDFGLNF